MTMTQGHRRNYTTLTDATFCFIFNYHQETELLWL